MVSEKKILRFSHYKSMEANDTPPAWQIYTPGASLAGFMQELLNIATY